MKNKKGISLIVLIITIIVVIILAAVVILTLSKNNPIESAKEARFKEDVRTFQDELALAVSKEYTTAGGHRDEKISTSNFDEIKEYIPSFSEKYRDKFVIKNDELVYTKNLDEKEKEYAQSLNFKKYSILPSEYQQVEYIESTGTQYIDTEYGITSEKEIELTCTWENVFDSNGNIITVSTENKGWGGNIDISGVPAYGFNGGGRQMDNRIAFWMGTNYLSDIFVSSTKDKKYTDKITILSTGTTNIQIIETESNSILYNTSISRVYNLSTRSIFLFKDNSNDPYPGVKKIYNFKIIENAKCVIDLYPCYIKKDNNIGMYDIINNKFYTNQGSGEDFIPGPDVD